MFDYEKYNLVLFASKLKERRRICGLSQEELADLAGCKQFDITRYENAKIYPQDDEILQRIANVLEIDPYYLKFSYNSSYTIQQTQYGKEIVLNHIEYNYQPQNEDQYFTLAGRDKDAHNERKFWKVLKANAHFFDDDDRAILLDVIKMLVMDKPEGQQILSKKLDDRQSIIDEHGRMRFRAPRL